MHNLRIDNFGPLVNVNLDSNKMIFILGEQATGKSTIAKMIYFFRTFQNEFIYLAFSDNGEEWRNIRRSYISLLKKKFTSIFGATRSLGKFNIKYDFNNKAFVTVKLSENNKYLDLTLSVDLDKNLEDVWNETRKILHVNRENAYAIYINIVSDTNAKKDLISKLQKIFDDDAYVVYIPAGRAFLSHRILLQLIQTDEVRRVSQESQHTPYDIIDAPTRNYIAEVNRVREWYLSPQTRERHGEFKKDAFVAYIEEMNKKIMKSNYIADKYNDYIEIKRGNKIPISFASSGQQEVVWILNLIYAYASEKRKCLLLIEEPETHLHPEAQYMLIKYITAFCNYTESQIVITTHSPYILSSFNNLIYADKIGKNKQKENEINKIISSKSWINELAFSSYIIENGINRNIKDEGLSMIDISELDAIASVQDDEYEKMLSISLEAE